MAFWMLANCKNGISSYELERLLAFVRTPHGLCHRIREAMKDDSTFQFGGPNSEVESDETFVGGRGIIHAQSKKERLQRSRKGQARRHLHGQDCCDGMLDRELRQVRCSVIPYVRGDLAERDPEARRAWLEGLYRRNSRTMIP